MSDPDDEFSEDEIDLDICNINVINIEENEEEDIGNNNDEDLEFRNNESNEGQEGDDGAKNKMTMMRVNLEKKSMMNKVKTFSKVTSVSHI